MLLTLFSIVKKKMLLRSLMRQSSFILERAVMDVMQSSRSVVRLYCHTEQVRPLRYWFSLKGTKVDEAQAAGADFVGGEELIPKIQNEGWLDFDVVVATPDMMGVVGRLGRVLGPKGLMPNPKAGTVTMDVTKAVNDIKAGKIEYRLDKTNIIHVPVGKASFTDEQLNDNFQSLMGAINKAKPASLKGQYIKSATLTSTMGPGVKLNVVKITQ